ncbi:hypothetical protein Cfor_06639, partial [Coptotermes formosanus]
YDALGLLRGAVSGRHFTSDQQGKEAARAWLVTKAKTLFSEDIQKRVSLRTKCVETCVRKNDATL